MHVGDVEHGSILGFQRFWLPAIFLHCAQTLFMGKSDEIQVLTTKWWTYSVLGVIMLAAGLVVLSEAIFMRVSGKEMMEWGWVMLVSVVIFNAGISFIGTSIKYRIYLDRKRKQESEFKQGSGSSHHYKSRSSGSHRKRSSSSSYREEWWLFLRLFRFVF